MININVILLVMKSNNKRKLIYTILLILWMLVIFSFSMQNGEQSRDTSDKVVEVVRDVTKTKADEDTLSYIVRKMAHITEYFILGFLMYKTLRSYNIKRTIALSIVFSIIYATTDETHQLLTGERTGQIKDVFIDSIGIVPGVLLSSKIGNNKFKNNN